MHKKSQYSAISLSLPFSVNVSEEDSLAETARREESGETMRDNLLSQIDDKLSQLSGQLQFYRNFGKAIHDKRGWMVLEKTVKKVQGLSNEEWTELTKLMTRKRRQAKLNSKRAGECDSHHL